MRVGGVPEHVNLPWYSAIESDELSDCADSAGRVIDYKIEATEQRFWSPHLSVQLYGTDEPQSTEAFCRFSPRPEIWTMVMAIYMVATCCLCGSLIFGFVQWTMGNQPWSLIIAPLSILVIVGLHLASLVGQGWSHDQMQLLRSRWDRTLEIAKGDASVH